MFTFELRGLPIRLVSGKKSLVEGEIELLVGDMSRAEKVKIDKAEVRIEEALEGLK